jgi:transcriptional regulator GlxA family with amidase domain
VALVPARANPFELAVACEVFGVDRSDLVDPWYEFRVAGGEGPGVATTGGLSLHTEYGLEALDDADTVIATPWSFIPGHDAYPEPVLEALRAAYGRGARMMSFCTGAFVLGAAGILDGRAATTHWHDTDELARRNPSARIDPNVLYVDDGQVLTAAGSASSIDLSLHVVRIDHGAEVANAVARAMVVPPHRDGGQAQYVQMPMPAPGPGPDPFQATLAWTLDHLDQPLAVADLAERAHMSERTFARRFRASTGATPHQWLLRQRVLHAQALLESTDAAIERVAYSAGFGSAAALRLHFQRTLGTSPQAYRRTFRVKDGRAKTVA